MPGQSVWVMNAMADQRDICLQLERNHFGICVLSPFQQRSWDSFSDISTRSCMWKESKTSYQFPPPFIPRCVCVSIVAWCTSKLTGSKDSRTVTLADFFFRIVILKFMRLQLFCKWGFIFVCFCWYLFLPLCVLIPCRKFFLLARHEISAAYKRP